MSSLPQPSVMLPPTSNRSDAKHFLEHFADAIGSLRSLAAGLITCAKRAEEPTAAIQSVLKAVTLELLAGELESETFKFRRFFRDPVESGGNESEEKRRSNWQKIPTMPFSANNTRAAAMSLTLLGDIVKNNDAQTKFDCQVAVNPVQQVELEDRHERESVRQAGEESIDSLMARIHEFADRDSHWGDERDIVDFIDRDQIALSSEKTRHRDRLIEICHTVKGLAVLRILQDKLIDKFDVEID